MFVKLKPMLPKPFLSLLSVLAFLVVLPSLAHGQVPFPNGKAWVVVEDLSVKVLGGAETGTTTAAGADEGAADETHERAVANVQTETKTLRAFNLEVQNAHTFFVGKDGVLVHNACNSTKTKHKKTTKKSDKRNATDTPTWFDAYKGQPPKGNSPIEAATNVMNDRYGEGNWSGVPGSDYNKIHKYIFSKWF